MPRDDGTQDAAAGPARLEARVAEQLRLPIASVRAVVRLLGDGATVPFIARYRKEQTGGLDEVAIRAIEEAHAYVSDLEQRRAAVLASIEEQGKLTPELRRRLETCASKSELEDLYLPFKPKRRTRALVARERGLEPLARRILAQPPAGDAAREAQAFVDAKKDVPDGAAALAGARDIVAELVSERADVRQVARERIDREGRLESTAVPAKTKVPTKFEAYYAFSERAKALPSHRLLALLRGEEEGVLRVKLRVDEDALAYDIATRAGYRRGGPFAEHLKDAAIDATKRLVLPSLETELRGALKEAADLEAAKVFAENVRELLLAAPLGRRVVLGIDPGQRTGCKCVVVDDTGKLLTHALVHLVGGPAALEQAKKTLASLIERFRPFAIAVGNGTHGRETADFAREVVEAAPARPGETALVVMVSESGASVYAASDVAREEFPDLDLTVRGAISIARRLQDPLAELVKIDPRAIGVGQYQHDVKPALLEKKLDEVIESAVNAVGVELNTASAPLLARVAGLGPSLAKKIVAHREKTGAFRSRRDLLKVPGLGPKAFEQAAGFVRIRGGASPLDASAVHPERYALIERIAKDAGVPVTALVGDEARAATIPWSSYVSAEVGLPTLEDIAKELAKPGRDPRQSFEAPAFRDDVRTIEDVKAGMELEGTVTNVTAFGAFVDLGVHQDGLVHVSQLSDTFVKDPHAVVHVGQRLRVRVVEVDLARKRIALTAKTRAPERRQTT
ncbi:MAG: Transcription accessory protein RNA-binding domain [Labilithrix sp.]|nr:Transcription accessory protein RNA-binding domain [Labilithrix sp.]